MICIKYIFYIYRVDLLDWNDFYSDETPIYLYQDKNSNTLDIHIDFQYWQITEIAFYGSIHTLSDE